MEEVPIELMTPEEPIPDTYESWSLFLICNPAWILPQGSEALLDLYDQFRAFGQAIGPAHAAIWFWSQPHPSELRSGVDMVRSSAYCSLLDLPLSESPYVVVTTDYPGAGLVSSYPETFTKPENYYVLGLNEAEAQEATVLLTALAERVVEERVDEADPQTESYWRRWQRSIELVRVSLLGVSNRVRVTFSTEFFSAIYEPE